MDMSEDGLKAAKSLIIRHEGFRQFPYQDTTGNLTIGYGHNLSKNGLSNNICSLILDDDINYWIDKVQYVLPVFKDLTCARQAVLLDMCFNIGLLGLIEFKEMIAAINANDFDKASDCMLESKWAQQVGSRAKDDAEIMRSGRL